MPENMAKSHRELYLQAVAYMRADRFDNCIAVTKHNLPVPEISQHYRTKNLVLQADASDDWYEVSLFQAP